ncbi:hypothetical protein BRCH_02602 [Candidatus Burkholderia brachyanthoides]|nr:hypothetical protein BRCH_02602 [Candidatus Burkholderia brachyanthoides]
MARPKADDFKINVDMLKQFDVVLPDGTQIRDLKTDEDIGLAKAMFGDRFAVGSLPASSIDLPVFSPLPSSRRSPRKRPIQRRKSVASYSPTSPRDTRKRKSSTIPPERSQPKKAKRLCRFSKTRWRKID